MMSQRHRLPTTGRLRTEGISPAHFLLLSLVLHGALFFSQHLLLRDDKEVGKPLPPVEVALVGPSAPSSAAGKTAELPAKAALEHPASPPLKPPITKPKAAKTPPDANRPPPKPDREATQARPQKAPVDPLPAASQSPAPTSSAKASESATSGAAQSDTKAPAAGSYEGPKVAAYLHNPKPEYPPMAKRREWEGRVILKVRVLASGTAGEVSVATSSGHEILDESALEAVRHWRFVPAKRGGQPVDSWVNVPLNFSLLDSK